MSGKFKTVDHARGCSHFFVTRTLKRDRFVVANILFSPLQSEMINEHIWNKIYHLSLFMLLQPRTVRTSAVL